METKDLFWFFGAIALVALIFWLSENKPKFKITNPKDWHWPNMPTTVNWKLVMALLALAIVLWIRLEGWILPDFFKKSWVVTALLVGIAFWIVYQRRWGLLVLLALILFFWGPIYSTVNGWINPKPGAGGNTSTTTTYRTYNPGDVIFDGMTPCHPIIPRGYDLTPTGPVKMVFQTESGTAIRRIREEAEAPPKDRLVDRPVVITSLTDGREYHIIIIAR